MIRIAQPEEYEAVKAFYYKLIDEMQGLPYHPKWQKGIYPSEEALHSALRDGELYLCTDGTGILAAMRVNHSATEGYDQVAWSVDARAEEVTLIHMLGVSVACQGQGLAKEMVRFVIEKAKTERQKAVRLDVLAGNVPAFRLYDALGFRRAGEVKLFYEDTGITDFTLYEYNL